MGRKSEQWQKAVVIGSIWASVEIILGSFLHNLKIPFSGSLLAMMAVILVSSFILRWKQNGIILRAALICALMKSVSPSAVILGPMTGILLEGLLMEMVFRVAGFNLISALLAGILAVSSALLHKIINLLLIYGEDIIRIYINLFQFAAKQLNIPDAGPRELLVLLLGGYTILGLLAGWMAFRVSRIKVADNTITAGGHQWTRREGQQSEIPLHAVWIFVHIVVLVSGLLLMNKIGLMSFLILAIPYFAFLLFRYKQGMRKIARTSLWYQLAFMAALSALFYDFPSYSDSIGTIKGLKTGVELMLRALFVISSFTALSIELRNPVVEVFLRKRGFSDLHSMMHLAFAMLPEVIASMPDFKTIFRSPLGAVAHMNQVGDRLLKRSGITMTPDP